MALEFNTAVKRIPSYPAAGGYGEKGDVAHLASNESAVSP